MIPKRKIAGNAFWQLVDKCTRAALGFVLFAATARSLGAEFFGQFALTLAIVSLISPLATLSIDRITVRDFVAEPDDAAGILNDTLILRFAGALLGALIAVAIAYPLYGADIARWTAIGSLVSVVQSLNVIDDYYQARLDSKRVAGAKIVALALACVMRGVLVWRHASVVWFVWAVVAETVVLYGLIVGCYIKDQGAIALRAPRVEFLRSRFKECWPLMISGLAYFAYMRLPQLTLARMKGEAEVGYYAVALRVAEGAVPLVHVIAASFYPALVKLYNDDRRSYFETYEKWSGMLAAISILFLIPVMLFSKQLIALVYGAQFAKAATPLVVVLFCLWVMIVTVFRAGYLTLAGMQKHLLMGCVMGVAVAYGIGYPLVERYGALGAAITYLVVQAVVVLGTDLIFKRTRNIARIHLKGVCLMGFSHVGSIRS